MKDRLKNKFLDLNSKNQKALVCFTTAGDPNLAISEKIISLLPSFGADIVEIGIPFSDPMADGPIIQKSSQRAIRSGINLKKILQIVKSFRKKDSTTPIILMGYFNPIFQFGLKSFFSKAQLVGVDGLIVVDLPPEENELISKYSKESNVDIIRLITPTTNAKRLKKILKSTSGFLYYISIMGITGTKKPSVLSVKSSVTKIKKTSKLPVVVGFGIDNSKQVDEINKFSDGCVIGSAIVKIIEELYKKKISEKTMYKTIDHFLTKLKISC